MTTVEFALAAPIFFAVLLGCLYVFLLAFSTSALRYAVEEAARCASVRTATCANDTSIKAYARQRYFGLGTPSFTYTQLGCGNSVSATVTPFPSSTTFGRTISASACFPLNS